MYFRARVLMWEREVIDSRRHIVQISIYYNGRVIDTFLTKTDDPTETLVAYVIRS